jgi:hypothetical protein
MASAVETSCTTTACPSAIAVSIAGSRGQLHRQQQLREEALLPLEDRQRCGFGTGVERPPLVVDDARGLSASRRLAWMIAYREEAIMRRNAA